MPITLRSTLLLTLSLSTLAGAGLAGSALATEPDPLQCAERFRNVRSVRYQPSNAKEYFEHGKGPAFWVKPFIPMRKVLLSGLYQLRRRPYPIIVLDNDTPKKANFLARSFFNRLNEQDAAYALDDVKKELETTLAYVKSYPQDIAAFVDAEATYRLQRLALEDALDQIANPKPGPGHG